MFFFFKQKTAYEMLRSLVGSEMCIRDRCVLPPSQSKTDIKGNWDHDVATQLFPTGSSAGVTVSYTHLTLPTNYSV